MAAPEGERIARLEARVENLEARLDRIEAKLDQVLRAINLGDGVKIAALKIGGFAVLVVTALGWLYDHVAQLLRGH